MKLLNESLTLATITHMGIESLPPEEYVALEKIILILIQNRSISLAEYGKNCSALKGESK